MPNGSRAREIQSKLVFRWVHCWMAVCGSDDTVVVVVFSFISGNNVYFWFSIHPTFKFLVGRAFCSNHQMHCISIIFPIFFSGGLFLRPFAKPHKKLWQIMAVSFYMTRTSRYKWSWSFFVAFIIFCCCCCWCQSMNNGTVPMITFLWPFKYDDVLSSILFGQKKPTFGFKLVYSFFHKWISKSGISGENLIFQHKKSSDIKIALWCLSFWSKCSKNESK